LNTRERLEKVTELQKSAGWSLLKEQIKREIYDHAIKQSHPNARATVDDLQFHRGVVYAASLFLELPERLATSLTTDLMIEQAQALAKNPAKAGSGEKK
jgi:hypothetical protein